MKKICKKRSLAIGIGISVMILLVTGWIYNLYRQQRFVQNQLATAQVKLRADSLALNRFTQFRENLAELLVAQGLPKDSLLEHGEHWNEMLQKVFDQWQWKENQYQADMANTREKLISVEAARQKLNEENATMSQSLESAQETIRNMEEGAVVQSHNMQRISDSLQTEITSLHDKLGRIRLDTLRISAPNGDKILYYGRVEDDRPNGYGIGFYEGKGYYVGEWFGNLRNGKGKHYYKNGDRYEGDFVMDIRQGYGIYFYAAGEIYKGEWKKDLMNGKGELVSKEGKSYKGTWEMGRRINNGNNTESLLKGALN